LFKQWRHSKKKNCFKIGFLDVFKSVWVVLSKNIFSFPKGQNCEGAKFGDFCENAFGKNAVTIHPLSRFS
jgi:hypothetical protein